MRQGITLLECLIYIGGCAFIAIITASLIIALFDGRDGGIIGSVNRFFACHAVMQALVDDVHYLNRGQGVFLMCSVMC